MDVTYAQAAVLVDLMHEHNASAAEIGQWPAGAITYKLTAPHQDGVYASGLITPAGEPHEDVRVGQRLVETPKAA